ncbi:MAG: hypothetical protein JW917_07940 [Ignavibacteria bacterium]|nr:hypothetical protein [Ignavibacteria bacterium]
MDISKNINLKEIQMETGKEFFFPVFLNIIIEYFQSCGDKKYTFSEFVFDSKYLLSLIKLFSQPVSDASLEKSQSEYFRMLEKFLGILESVRKNLGEKERILFDASFSPSGGNSYENIVLLLSDLTAIKDYKLMKKS